MRKILLIKQIEPDFDPKIHIPISPSCFLNAEETFPDFDYLKYIDVVETKEEYPYYDKLTNNEAIKHVKILGIFYFGDKYFDYSPLFWKSIFYPWLSLFIPYLFWTKTLLDKVIHKYSEENITVKCLDPEELSSMKFYTKSDFEKNALRNPNFFFLILSALVEKNKPAKWTLIKESILVPVIIQNTKLKKKLNINALINKFLFRAKKSYGLNLYDRILLNLLLFAKKPIKDRHQASYREVDSNINWGTDITDFLKKFTPVQIKNLNLERPPRKYTQGKLVCYSNELYNNSAIDAAFAYHFGEVVLADQHGGHMYGSGVSMESVNNTEFSADFFISWGWTKYNNKELNNILPLPSPLLSKFYNKNKPIKNQILFAGTSMNLLNNNFNSGMSAIEMLSYRRNKIKILQSLEAYYDIEQIVYRPHIEGINTLQDSAFLISKYPNLQILSDKKKVFHQALLNTCGIILDHPGTTLNIAFAANIPIIMIWNKNWFPFNDESSCFLGEFEKKGIFYNSPYDLSLGLADIFSKYKKLNDWWMQRDIQKLRKEWMNNYALCDQNWRKSWLKTLKGIN